MIDGNTTHVNNMTQNIADIAAATSKTAINKSIVEMHGLRTDKNHCLNDDLCNHNDSGLQLMTLPIFCQNTHSRNKQ